MPSRFGFSTADERKADRERAEAKRKLWEMAAQEAFQRAAQPFSAVIEEVLMDLAQARGANFRAGQASVTPYGVTWTILRWRKAPIAASYDGYEGWIWVSLEGLSLVPGPADGEPFYAATGEPHITVYYDDECKYSEPLGPDRLRLAEALAVGTRCRVYGKVSDGRGGHSDFSFGEDGRNYVDPPRGVWVSPRSSTD